MMHGTTNIKELLNVSRLAAANCVLLRGRLLRRSADHMRLTGGPSVVWRRCELLRLYSVSDRRTSMAHWRNDGDRQKLKHSERYLPECQLFATNPTQTAWDRIWWPTNSL